MKRLISAALLGIIAAFWLLQALYFYQHGFSFTVAFHNDPFFLVRFAFWGAATLIFVESIRVLAGQRIVVEFRRVEVLSFFAGGIATFALAFYLKTMEPADYKVLPYSVVPKLFLIALGSFWMWVFINWRTIKR